MRTILLMIWLTLCSVNFGFSQGNFILPSKYKSDKVRFQLANNLIIIPVEINGIKLSFLLDSGVSKPILFNNMSDIDSLQINNVELIHLRGLGNEGSVEALKSRKNVMKIGKAVNVNTELFIVFDEGLNFTPRLGVEVHGIIGYDFFKDFVVEINYARKFIRFHDPVRYVFKTCKKCETFNLSFNNNKPFIDAEIEIESRKIPVKLLIDSGGSDALWLFEDEALGIKPDTLKYFEDFLGKGLSGNLYGKRTKIQSFSLNDFKFENVNVSFPDSSSINIARNFKQRNGTISAELLRRFNLIFDYTNAKISMAKNGSFNDDFHYNKSGITLEQDGVRVLKELDHKPKTNYGSEADNVIIVTAYPDYKFSFKPAFRIVELRKDSPAERSGLMVGDIVLSVNNKDTHSMKLGHVMEMFKDDDGKTIRVTVDRNGAQLTFKFQLEKLF